MQAEAVRPHSSYRGQASPRDRSIAATLSLAILVCIVLVLLRMGYLDQGPHAQSDRLTAINLPVAGSAGADKPRARPKEATAAPAQANPLPLSPPPIVPPRPPIPAATAPAPSFIPMSRADMASADIGKMAKGGGAGTGNSSATYGPGEGPSGQRLYRAEWYREPSDAEIAGYMPTLSRQPEWAEIACKTVEHYHVENCQALGESPPGSGLARALRQAAWQFLVRPPRIDGKPQIGSWVKIHFDFVRGEVK